MRNRKRLAAILAAGIALVVALGSQPAAAVGKTASSTTGVTTSRLMCRDFIDGDGKMINQPVGFYFQVVNGYPGGQVVNLEFAVPARFKPSAEPVIIISSPMVTTKPIALLPLCFQPPSGLSAASKARCHSAPSAFAGLKHWICPNVPVPVGHWRWVGFKVSFAKAGNRWTRFWATGEVTQTKPDTISTGL